MVYVVFQCIEDPDYFIVTDVAHENTVPTKAGPSNGELKRIGTFEEMGEDRVAFDEKLANDAIKARGYYIFEATSFAPIPESPEMPG